jgi:hypothetical protein
MTCLKEVKLETIVTILEESPPSKEIVNLGYGEASAVDHPQYGKLYLINSGGDKHAVVVSRVHAHNLH